VSWRVLAVEEVCEVEEACDFLDKTEGIKTNKKATHVKN